MLIKNTGGALSLRAFGVSVDLPRGTTEVDPGKWSKVADTHLAKRELARKRLVVLGAGQPEPQPETGEPAGDPPADQPAGEPSTAAPGGQPE